MTKNQVPGLATMTIDVCYVGKLMFFCMPWDVGLYFCGLYSRDISAVNSLNNFYRIRRPLFEALDGH